MTILKELHERMERETIENRTFTGLHLILSKCKYTTIRNCVFINSSVKALNCFYVSITNCVFTDSGVADGKDIVHHAVQFDKCKFGYIAFNTFRERVGDSLLSDTISLYKSYGGLGEPIVIEFNLLFGGGPHPSGGGIMLGDNMGDYQIARFNTLINPGQYGIAIAGGNHNEVSYNTILGELNAWSNVGIYVWGQKDKDSTPKKGYVDNALIRKNIVSWVKHDQTYNTYWNGPNTTNVVLENNEFDLVYTLAQYKMNHFQ